MAPSSKNGKSTAQEEWIIMGKREFADATVLMDGRTQRMHSRMHRILH